MDFTLRSCLKTALLLKQGSLKVERVYLHHAAQCSHEQCSQTYMNLLQSGDKQMCDLCHLAEREAGDWAAPLVQC